MSSVNLWKLAVEQAFEKAYEKKENKIPPTTLYLLGNTKVGKTSIIDELLLRTGDMDRGEFGLEYCHGTSNFIEQKVPKEVSVMEFAGAAYESPELLAIPINTNEHLGHLVIVLVLDLSCPDKMWLAFEKSIELIKKAYTDFTRGIPLDEEEKIRKKLQARIDRRNVTNFEVEPSLEDKQLNEFFPFPLVIIGGKYDAFVRQHEPKTQKVVCRLLRLLALKYQATLAFYSAFDLTLNHRIREILEHYAYDTEFPQKINTNYLEPILIPPHTENWKEIQFPLELENCSLASLKKFAYQTFGITPDQQDQEPPFDPATDKKFREIDIDLIYEEEMEKILDEEFEQRYREEKERRDREFYPSI